MKRVHLADTRTVRLRHRVVSETLSVLRSYGTRGCEGMVLWTGTVEPEGALVTDVLEPPQESIRSEDGVGYLVSTETLIWLNRFLSEKGLRLIAQVHSHPAEAYHSRTDDQYAIVTAEGGYSLVVPDFGHAPATPAAWAVYRLTEGQWKKVPEAEVERTFIWVS